MPTIFFVLSAFFVMTGLLMLFFAPVKRGVLFNHVKINKISSPENMGLFCAIFSNKSLSLYSMPNQPFLLKNENEDILKIDFYCNNVLILKRKNIFSKKAFFEEGKVKLCVKHDICSIMQSKDDKIDILIDKKKSSYYVSSQKNHISFDFGDFFIETDGDIKFDKAFNYININITKATKTELKYSSLGLLTFSQKENKRRIKKQFGVAFLDIDKPNFTEFQNSELVRKYAKTCLKKLKFHYFIKSYFSLNLTTLGFTRWVKAKKRGNKIFVEDWLTGYKIKIEAETDFYLCCYFGEMFLCFMNNNFKIIDNPLESDEILHLKYNWQFFNRNNFEIAYKMLCEINRNNNDKFLKNKVIARFIYNAIPKRLKNTSQHYNFVRELYPYIKNKELQRRFLLYMQNYEQMFYKKQNVWYNGYHSK